MGLFIVKPEFRGIGLGKKLWYQRRDLLLTRLEKTASIGMDGVVDMQTFYSKGGFKIAFIDKRYERSGNEFKIDANISNIIPSDFDKIIDYDSECFGLARPQFLIPWLNMPGSFYYKYEENSKIKGFAVLRKATIGYKIGPLYADNALIADELYKACLNSVIDESVFMDIPMNNNEAVELVLRYDAKYVFECARMYYGQPLKAHHGKVFALTTFELG